MVEEGADRIRLGEGDVLPSLQENHSQVPSPIIYYGDANFH
jgi:hypothetical protein